jgi:sulfatase maturation enzyme AslB (radical SAM superfamily)
MVKMSTSAVPVKKDEAQADLNQSCDIRFLDISTLVVKVTRRCNLNCEYCYENITNNGDMDIQVFKDLASKAFLNSKRDTIEFLFHGGEPIIITDEFFIKAFSFCQSLAEKTQKKLKAIAHPPPYLSMGIEERSKTKRIESGNELSSGTSELSINHQSLV